LRRYEDLNSWEFREVLTLKAKRRL